MDTKPKRVSSGGRASRGGQSKTPEQFLEQDSNAFAAFLVGRRVEVTEPRPEQDALRVNGIVRKQENSEKSVRRSITCLCSCCIDVPDREQGDRYQQHTRWWKLSESYVSAS